MKSQIKAGLTIGVWVLLVVFTGCFFEKIAWSPDGRYVVYSDYSDRSKLWEWDSKTGETREIPLKKRDASGKEEIMDECVQSCRYLPSGREAVVVMDQKESKGERYGIYLLDPRWGLCAQVASDALPCLDVSGDGKRILYMKHEQGRMLSLNTQNAPGEKTLLTTKGDEITFLCADAAGKRILYSGDSKQGLCLLDRDSGTTQDAPTRREKGGITGPGGSSSRAVFYKLEDQKPDMVGELQAYSLEDKTTRTLCANVHLLYSPISFSPDRKSVVVAAARVGAGERIDENEGDIWQVASVNIATGQITWLTNAALGALAPVWSPDGKRLAYLSGTGEGGVLLVLDLETKKTTFTWRDEQEKLFAAAESAAQSGDSTKALANWKELTERFPTSEIRDAARYRMAMTYLSQPQPDLDAAYDVCRKIENNHLSDQIRPLIWREEDRVATDPAEDWIQTYGTEAAQKEFKFNTDLTRDLRALWVRCGKERLYVRIDYGSDKDLTGLTFQDTLILLRGEDTRMARDGATNRSPSGMRRLSPTAEWDRPADRQIFIRHWFNSGDQSQYDMEILNEKGEIIARYLASGFAPPANPLFEVAYWVPETNSVGYAISRQTLGLVNAGDVGIQVCTFKGGIESVKGLERPRVAAVGGRTVCDVADTFGAENTKARIEAGLKANANPAAPVVIKGLAATIKIPAMPKAASGSQ